MQGFCNPKSVDRSALMASLPDNQGRDNLASSAIMDIMQIKLKTLDFFNAKNGSLLLVKVAQNFFLDL